MAKQSEIAQQLAASTQQFSKAAGEIRQKITDLETAVQNQDNASPELVAAADALKAQAQALDDIVADAPATEPNQPPAEPS